MTSASIVPNQNNQTLYAHWTSASATYTVTFDKNAPDATTPAPSFITVTNGQAYGTLSSITRPGFTFGGWWTTSAASGGSQVLASTTVNLSGNQTLVADWSPVLNPGDEWEWNLDVRIGSGGGSYHILRCDEAGWILEVETNLSGIYILGIIQEGDLDLQLPSHVWNQYYINTIHSGAFANSGITSVSIPVVEQIEDYAFENCWSLSSVTFNGAPPEYYIGNYSFVNTAYDIKINVYTQYTNDWQQYVSSGSFPENTAVSVFQRYDYAQFIPFNVLTSTPQTHPSVDGHDGVGGTGDDIIVPGGIVDGGSGYITVPGTSDGSDVKHLDGTNLEGGNAPGGSIIVNPDIVIRPGTGSDPVINGGGTIHVTPGNTIDVDGDGLPPWVVPEDGNYDPRTGIFTPTNPSHPPIVVPPTNFGNLVGALISTISVSTTLDVTLTWFSAATQYGVGSQSVLFGKVDLQDANWTPLSESGLSLSAITDTSVVIPVTLIRAPGENYRFFMRMVRQP